MKLRNYALSKSWPDLPSSDVRRLSWRILSLAESGYTALATISTLYFLYEGGYRNLSERFSQISLATMRPSSSREVSYEFMNRQMAWHAFTEFLLFALPLGHWTRTFKKMRRRVSAHFGKLYTLRSELLPAVSREFLEPSGAQCTICAERAFNVSSSLVSVNLRYQHPIQTPYVTSCGHRYCYFCISEKILRAAEEDSYWECLVCSRPVYNILRVQEDHHDGEDSVGV